ncbi:MAG TPA: hypothetical protein VNJ53_06155 [Gaiellaceae bacterium]|nr:hypothetical protein [Gaiellaceae bacterium]
METATDFDLDAAFGPEILSEDLRVVLWRTGTLSRAGYDSAAALELALDRDVDLHAAVDLLERGCPQPTALRILL